MRGKRPREEEIETINPHKRNKKCRCGSYTHMRTSSRLCRLNECYLIESTTEDSFFTSDSNPKPLQSIEMLTHEQLLMSPINDLYIESPNIDLTPISVRTLADLTNSQTQLKAKSCDRCGEISHSSIRSYLCRLNPNAPTFISITKIPIDFPSFWSPPLNYTPISESRTCRCGSTGHSRTNHRSCILNKKNLHGLSSEKTKKIGIANHLSSSLMNLRIK